MLALLKCNISSFIQKHLYAAILLGILLAITSFAVLKRVDFAPVQILATGGNPWTW